MSAESTVPDDHQSPLDPTFTVVRRGFDQSEVRRALIGLAGDLRAARERELLLARQLAEAERRVEAVDPLDPSHLTKLLGDEVARILDAARAAAAQIRARADEAATRLFDETKAEAAADAAAVIERAELEAREILRLARERSGDPVGDPVGGAIVGAVEDPDSGSVIEVGPEDRTRPPTQQRSGRSGVDASRTAGLFASLREQQASRPAPRPKATRRSVEKRSAEKKSVARGTPAPESTAAGSEVGPRTSTASKAQTHPGAGSTSSTSAGPAGVSLSAELSRTIRRTLTDDLNALLAELARSGGRGGSIMVSLDPETGPTVSHHIECLMAAFDSIAPSIDRATTPELAKSLAEAIVGPIRVRIDEILAASIDDPGGVPTRLRACFRQYRSELVDPAVRSVLASMQH